MLQTYQRYLYLNTCYASSTTLVISKIACINALNVNEQKLLPIAVAEVMLLLLPLLLLLQLLLLVLLVMLLLLLLLLVGVATTAAPAYVC